MVRNDAYWSIMTPGVLSKPCSVVPFQEITRANIIWLPKIDPNLTGPERVLAIASIGDPLRIGSFKPFGETSAFQG